MNHEVGHDLNTILNMTGPQGNIGVGLFYAAYILFEVVRIRAFYAILFIELILNRMIHSPLTLS
jgi:hypothetical protein